MAKAVLISVGGSPNPVILSLNTQRPDYVIFFASAETRSVIREDVEPKLLYRPKDWEIITTPDEQNLVQSVSVLLKRVPEIIGFWQIGAQELVGDYTCGTKTMAAAVVLVLLDKGGTYSYIGGTARDKNGKGVVVDGHEQMLHLQNPWDVLAVTPLKEIELLFNRCRFQTVMDLAEKTARKVDRNRPFFEAIKVTAEAFYNWDNFYYEPALNLMKRAESMFRNLASLSRNPAVTEFHKKLKRQVEQLQALNDAFTALVKPTKGKGTETIAIADGSVIIQDILANAMRRAGKEFKYDDAVARIYGAVEKLAKLRLKAAYGIDNSNLDPAMIPDATLREELTRQCLDPHSGRLRIPLHKSYELLGALDDPLGHTYAARSEELRNVLNIRNMSLLAHGFAPVKKDTYDLLLQLALAFSGVDADDLPVFPDMAWGDQGLA